MNDLGKIFSYDMFVTTCERCKTTVFGCISKETECCSKLICHKCQFACKDHVICKFCPTVGPYKGACPKCWLYGKK